METAGDEIPSVKDLASSDPTLRRRALSTISAHLRTRTTSLTPTQALQLQKGFFYALYMHDSKSPTSVQTLIALLADLTVSPARTNLVGIGVPLTEAFWTTMAREWTNIDALRMDKYLLWVRMVVRGVFTAIKIDREAEGGGNGGDDETKVSSGEEQIALLEKFPLSPRERKVPDGLRYHVLDVYVDELEKMVGQDREEEEERVSEEVRDMVERLLVPVEIVAKEGLSKGVRVRAKEVLADKRVVEWRMRGIGGSEGGGDNTGRDAQDEWGGLD